MSVAEAIIFCLAAHMVGDYIFQSDWMAAEKTKRWWPAVAHGVTYTLPFLLVTRSPLALLFICGTHIVIDHWRLARYVVWAKNQLVPYPYRHQLTDTGYGPDKPAWMAVWLLIAADNVIHMALNVLAVLYAP